MAFIGRFDSVIMTPVPPLCDDVDKQVAISAKEFHRNGECFDSILYHSLRMYAYVDLIPKKPFRIAEFPLHFRRRR